MPHRRIKYGMVSIRGRIYLSFLLLVLLFIVNGVITIITLNSNKELSRHLNKVVEPSLQSLDDFKKMMVESKMYTTNWVFLRSRPEDKELLKQLHTSGYNQLKARMIANSASWKSQANVKRLGNICVSFE